MVKKIKSAKLTDASRDNASQIWKKSMVGKTVYACTLPLVRQERHEFGVSGRHESPHLCQAQIAEIAEEDGVQKVLLRPINFVVVGEKDLHTVRECESWCESPVEAVLGRVKQVYELMANSIHGNDIDPIAIVGDHKNLYLGKDSPFMDIFMDHNCYFLDAYRDVLTMALRIEQYKNPLVADPLFKEAVDLLNGWTYEDNFRRCVNEGRKLDRSDAKRLVKDCEKEYGVFSVEECFRPCSKEKGGTDFLCTAQDLYNCLRSNGLEWKIAITYDMLEMHPERVLKNSEKRIPGAKRMNFSGFGDQVVVGTFKATEECGAKSGEGLSACSASSTDGAECRLRDVDKETPTQKKKTCAKKTAGKGRWVWKLIAEDITEFESEITLWPDREKAKAAMEKSIQEITSIYKDEDCELERDDDDHATLEGQMMWSIEKVKIND